ncbi:DUF6870 family protein [Oscillibacter sp. GMB15532]|uniref:DUF6870 family protein n=1 Tax=Oscillibacter sp. GMB15532 TaxID=3230022 RepID=UPI0034DEE83E
MISSQALFKMSQVDITEVNTKDLMEAAAISVSQELPHQQRVLSVIEALGNPYCFLSGDTPVRVRFTTEEKSLSDCLVSYFSQLKQG